MDKRFYHMEFERALGEDIQVLQFQAIDQLHFDSNGNIVLIIKLETVNLNYPIFKFNRPIEVLDGRAEIVDSSIYFNTHEDDCKHPLYMYLDNTDNSITQDVATLDLKVERITIKLL